MKNIRRLFRGLRRILCAVGPAVAVLLAPAVHSEAMAALLAYEGFEYPSGTQLSGQSGGSGWGANWTSGLGSMALGGSLAYTDAAGNRLLTTGNRGFLHGGFGNAATFRVLPSGRGADGTTTWISFLAIRQGPPVEAANIYPRAASLSLFANVNNANVERLSIGNVSGAPQNTWALTPTAALANRQGTTVAFSQTNTLVLVRIDHKPGHDDAYLFLNPALGAEPSLESADAKSIGAFDFSFDRVRPFAGNNDVTNNRPYSELQLDEIRIGDSYAAVTPFVSAPAPSGLMAVNRFDSPAEAGQWSFEFGGAGQSVSFDPGVDAGNDPSSGSLKIIVNLDASLGGENKAAFRRDLGGALDGSFFALLQMDVRVAAGSADDGAGTSVNASMVVRNGPESHYNPQFHQNLGASGEWMRLEAPLTGSIDQIRALTWHLWGAAPFNISGTVTLWIDNVVLKRKPILVAIEPPDQKIAAGESATFTAQATAEGAVSYQWQFNGADLAGETGATLSLANVQSAQAGSYRVVVSTATEALASRGASLRVAEVIPGLWLEHYLAIPGITVSSLINHAKFPDEPDLPSKLSSFEIQAAGDHYGARLSGFVIPPVTGEYVFYVSSDDQSELYLSPGQNPAHKQRIASEPQWNGPREWQQGVNQASRGNPPANISRPIHLVQGQRYFVELLMKQGLRGNHAAVAWRLPGGTVPVNGSEPIGGEFLEYESGVHPIGPVPESILSVTNADDSGPGSLRQAMLDANAQPGLQAIHFAIPGSGPFSITPVSPLPAITDPVRIDGYTQAGSQINTQMTGHNGVLMIALNGSQAGANADGLVLATGISSGGSVIRGLAINRFSRHGIWIQGGERHWIEGNFVGLNEAGTGGAGNGGYGVHIDFSSRNLIGGGATGARNVISGNNAHGVFIANGSSRNVVRGNYIGVAKDGSTVLGNGAAGIRIDGSNRNVIGATSFGNTVSTGYGNVISGNAGDGIQVVFSPDNVISNNRIGTDAGGSNARGNLGAGIVIDNAAGNQIGNTLGPLRNVICGNAKAGIELRGDEAVGNTIQGNFIGLKAGGTALPNQGDGILIDHVGGLPNGFAGNLIGGTTLPESNRIENNGLAGVRVLGAGTVQIGILGNQILNNGGLGIDLGENGVTANDAEDADGGPNQLQNFPVLASVHATDDQVAVHGTLQSRPQTQYRIELFSSASADASGFGEGGAFLTNLDVTTDAQGAAVFYALARLTNPAGRWITATATNPENNTSEFSRAVQASGGGTGTMIALFADQFETSEDSLDVNHQKSGGRQTGAVGALDYVEHDSTQAGGSRDGRTAIVLTGGSRKLELSHENGGYSWVSPNHDFLESRQFRIEASVHPGADHPNRDRWDWAGIGFGGHPGEAPWEGRASGLLIQFQNDGTYKLQDAGQFKFSGGLLPSGELQVRIDVVNIGPATLVALSVNGTAQPLNQDGSMVYVRTAPWRRNYMTLSGSWSAGGILHTFDNLSIKADPSAAPSVSFIPKDASGSEGQADPAVVEAIVFGTRSEPLTIPYATSGTAQAGADFKVLAGSITIPAGQHRAAIHVLPLDDQQAEGAETVALSIAPGAGYLSNSQPAVITIIDDEQPAGFLARSVYDQVSGYVINDLINSPKFPDHPDWVEALPAFESTGLTGDYGVRLSGFLLPPVAGEYIFFLSADHEGQLFLSTDENPANQRLIAREPEWNGARQWTNANNQSSRGQPPENVSAPITLEPGRKYYIEALLKEGSLGNGHIEVTWQKPGDPAPANGSEPIPGAHLEYYVPGTGVEPPDPLRFEAGKSSGPGGGQLVIPIITRGFSNIVNFQGSIHWDPEVAEFKAVEQFGLPELSSANFGATEAATGALRVSWDDAAATGKTVPDGSAIFALRFQLVGPLGSKSPVRMDGTPAALEATRIAGAGLQLISVVTDDGEIQVANTLKIAGTAKYYSEDRAIPGVVFELSGDAAETQTSGPGGDYEFGVPAGGSFVVRPGRPAEQPPTQGVTTLDITLIRRHILGIAVLDSPYKILAADVNGSSSVTTLDITLIRRLILGITSDYPVPSWRFVPANSSFADPNAPWNHETARSYANLSTDALHHDFIGVKLGDVNGSWTPAGAALMEEAISGGPSEGSVARGLTGATGLKSTASAPVRVVVGPAGASGHSVRVPVLAQSFQGVTSLQFTLAWDPERLMFRGVETRDLRGLGPENLGFPRHGTLTFSWDDPQGTGMSAADGTEVLALNFEVLGRGASQLTFASEPTPPEASVRGLPARLDREGGVVLIGSLDHVRPTIISVTRSSAAVTIELVTEKGLRYALEATESWGTTFWKELSVITGDGTVQQLTDPAAAAPQRFYRVRRE